MNKIEFNSYSPDLPNHTMMQKQKWFLYLVLLIHVFFLLIYLKFESLIYVIGAFAAIFILQSIIFNLKNTIILLFCYISFLPGYSWGIRYKFFRGIYFDEKLLLAFFFLILVWIIIDLFQRFKTYKLQQTSLDWTIGSFIIIIILSALRGGLEGFDLTALKIDAVFLSLYIYYFIYVNRFQLSDLQTLINALSIITIFVSIEYIMLAFSEATSGSILIKRVVTQQPHVAQISLPIFASYLFFPNAISKKILATIALIPLAGMIFFSQQRGLWVGITFSLILVGGFAFIKEQISLKKITKYITIILLIILILFLLFLIFDKLFFGSIFITFLSRVKTLSTLSADPSTNIRLAEIIRAFKQWDNNIVTVCFGTGLGAAYESVDLTRPNHFSVDNSYAFILWKMGIVGLIVFLLIIYSFFKKGLYVFKKSNNTEHRQIVAALMSGFGGLLIIALTNTCVARYRFIIIWSLIIAIIEIMYNHTEKSTIQNK